ncbi:MAG: hypothetical protein D6796_07830, partial [Caldilineae bacterium]
MKPNLLPLFLFLFALYLLTYAPAFHSSDGLAMFATAESLARRGAWDVEQIRWMGLQQGTFGRDGLLYSRKGVGQPLLALPLAWLGLVLPGFGPATATLLFGSLVTALTGVLVMRSLQRLDYDDRTALLGGLVYGAGTLAWPYAKTFFSDTLAGTLLLAGSLALLRFRQTGRDRFAALGGLALGWAVATRYAEAVFLPVGGLLLLAYLRQRGNLRRPAALARSLTAFAAPPLLIGAGLMAFNYARYGNPLNTGYLPQETFSAVWWRGILGQLLSPGRGLLLYNPLLLLAFFGLRAAHRRHPPETWNALAVILIHLLLYGKWFMWHGGFAWGPRFMVATLPFWVLLMAPALEKALRGDAPRLRHALWGLAALTLLLQIPGLAVDFDLWQNRLLETGLPLFAPETFFRLRYSPLVGTWGFLRPENLDVAWANGGRIAGGVLALLLVNLAMAGWLLGRAFASRGGKGWSRPAGGLLALVAALVLLNHAHRSEPAPLRRALSEVNRLPAAPLVYDDPEKAVAVSEWYAGRAPVLGLAAPETERLAAVTASAPALWWLTTFGGETEARLLAEHGVARAETFDGVRLLLLAKPDAPPRTVDVRLGESITLQRVRLSSALRPPYPLAVTLTWQATRPLAADYRVFLHLLNAQGEIVAQAGGQPVHWTRPTSTWAPGDPVTDPYALSLPP